MLPELLTMIYQNLADVLIYTAIGLVTLIGIFKCVIPVSHNAFSLKRAVRKLENGARSGDAPAWQDGRYLGHKLQPTWQRFLTNAEQMDMRGLSLDVAEYVNEETVIDIPGRAALADLIPGLLTSLGILGTFVGLMRGLSGLDMTDSSRLMAGIPVLINGMRTAFATSIAGVSCSLCFNFLNRMVIGRAVNAIDDFEDAFKELAIGLGMDCDVQLVCQQQDQNVILHRSTEDMATKLATTIEGAIGRAMQPVSDSMDRFIAAATREQMDGLERIVNNFVRQMNSSLNGQFVQLGDTLARMTKSQTVTGTALNESLDAAQTLVENVRRVQGTTDDIIVRFEEYVKTMAQVRASDEGFEKRSEELLMDMHAAAKEQASYAARLQEYQNSLQNSFRQYTSWNDQLMESLRTNNRDTQQRLNEVAQGMNEGARVLQANYTAFSEEISGGLARSLGMFDSSVRGLMTALGDKLDRMSQAAEEQDRYVATMARLEVALQQMTETLKKE